MDSICKGSWTLIFKRENWEWFEKLSKYLPTYEGLNDDTIKRVYLPTVVFVKKGKILGLEQSLEAFSKRVGDDPYQEMTTKEKDELAKIFKEYYDKLK